MTSLGIKYSGLNRESLYKTVYELIEKSGLNREVTLLLRWLLAQVSLYGVLRINGTLGFVSYYVCTTNTEGKLFLTRTVERVKND